MNPRKNLASQIPDHLPEGLGGRKFWRALNELGETEEFQDLMRREFPEQADVWPDSLSRRRFLTLMGASLALAGLNGCSVKPAPRKKIVPYVHPPRDVVAGEPLFFATAMPFPGGATGLLVESHMGRPTKVEGNPDHPTSLGATTLYNQASVLSLYDPDRSQAVTYLGQTRTWDEALDAKTGIIAKFRENDGKGFRILSEPILSPTLAAQKDALLESLPQAKWHIYEPVHEDAALRGSQMAFGRPVHLLYDMTKADVVLSLDADFLACSRGSLSDVSDFMSRRQVHKSNTRTNQPSMNRLYVAETAVTSTGVKADHRLALQAREIETLARSIAANLGIDVAEKRPKGFHDSWCSAVAEDLKQHPGRYIVLAGIRQPATVHLLAHAINEQLGNVGQTVLHADPMVTDPLNVTESLGELVNDIEQGRVQSLLILGGNPAYNAPADFGFAKAIEKVPLRVHCGMYQDETARLCQWHLPEAHFLESWGDTRAGDGTASIVQPLIEPLHAGRSFLELVNMITTLHDTPGDDIVRQHWQAYWDKQHPTERFSDFWKTSLHDGLIQGTAFFPQSVPLVENWQQHLQMPAESEAAEKKTGPATSASEFELDFQPDPTIYDGRFANNGWLQELPKPVTKLTWDNAALMSPRTARELGLGYGSYAHGGEHGGYHMPIVKLTLDGRAIDAPVWIVPGHADGSITVSLGYGRSAAGSIGGNAQTSVGFDAYRLRQSKRPWFASGLVLATTGETALVACTQQHHLMENRHLVRAATLAEFQQYPDFAHEPDEHHDHETVQEVEPLTFYEGVDYEPPLHKWGMGINLTACVGCKACVVACQAENNIPVVGKEQVAAGREMHWLRIDRYISGEIDDPEDFHFQPVPCMHCENAPCEYVCPVEATVHSREGLNDMIYNRCVGTRFCSNNCPYKVRRFNFLEYSVWDEPLRQMQYNPDVTVRSRGVMEKCSYCVQRIRQAEIDSEKEDRPVIDGEVVTACQAACPAKAIVFGDLNDPDSEVSAWKRSPLNYGLLTELNTEPRTTYLAALRNPNPKLEEV